MFGKARSADHTVSNPGAKNRFFAMLFAVIVILGLIFLASTEHGTTLLQFRFNPWALLSGTTVFVNSLLLIYFLRKPARTDERVWLAVYMVGLISYAVGELFWRLSANPQAAVFWTNISDMGVLIPSALYLFVLAYTNRTEKRYVGLTALLLLGSLVYMHLVGTTDLVYDNSPAHYVPFAWGYDVGDQGTGGQALILGLFWFFGLPFLAWLRLLSFRRHTRNQILRKQSLIFIWASVIPIGVGIFTDILLPSFGVRMPAFGITMFTPGAILIVYGLIRYQLLTVSPTLFSNTILAIMQEAVVATDDKFNVIYLNATAETLLGVKNESSSKAELEKALTPESLAAFKQAFSDGSKDTVSIERIDIARSHETPVPIRLTSSKLHLGDNDTWVMILTDITAELHTRSIIEHEVQVRTEELHQARAYLVSSINSLEQGFILVNAHSKVELTNNMVNKLCKKDGDDLSGHEIAEVMGLIGWNIDLAKVIGNVMEGEHARRLDTTSADGSYYQVYVTPVLAGRQVLGAAVVIEDVTEQKILDRSKDEFFSIASHELRTPLTAIRGNMSMVEQYYPEALKDDTLKTLVVDSHEASTRLIEIVNDFLDSSSLEQGKMVFRLAPLSVKPIIESAQKEMATLLAKANATVKLDGLDKLPQILGDEARFRQIVGNLMSNAAKYGSDKVTITFSGEVAGHNLRLYIADTGKGMSPEHQKLLFHKFQQAGDSILTRDNTKGTGLGLYISRLLATNMHGNVELDHSEEGKGTTFVITMPLASKTKH